MNDEQTQLESVPEQQEQKPEEKPVSFGPGFIDVDLGHGQSVPACKLVSFTSATSLNAYFEENRKLKCIKMFPHGDYVSVLVAQRYDEQEYEDMMLVQEVMATELAKLRADREAAKEAAEEARLAAELSEEELKELGRKCQHNHGGVIEENSRLKKELKKLRKGKK